MQPTKLEIYDLPAPIDGHLATRICKYVEVDLNGCWIWAGGTEVDGGYKQVRFGGGRSKSLVHRMTYTVFVGEIPSGYQVDHLCHVPSCCNPDHLEAVTPGENIKRRDARRSSLIEQVAYWKQRALEAERYLPPEYIAPEPTMTPHPRRAPKRRADRVEAGTHHNAKKTHCPQGHPYTLENTSVDSRGIRSCRRCARAADQRYKARKKLSKKLEG